MVNLLKLVFQTGAMKQSQYPAHVTVHKPPRKRTSSETKEPKSPTKRLSIETKGIQETKDNENHTQKKEDLYARYVAFDNNLIPHMKTIVNAFDFSIHQTVVDLGGRILLFHVLYNITLLPTHYCP